MNNEPNENKISLRIIIFNFVINYLQDRIDGDPDATPYDDLRHYAYEGDGNSGGSLSSLNSGTSGKNNCNLN